MWLHKNMILIAMLVPWKVGNYTVAEGNCLLFTYPIVRDLLLNLSGGRLGGV